MECHWIIGAASREAQELSFLNRPWLQWCGARPFSMERRRGTVARVAPLLVALVDELRDIKAWPDRIERYGMRYLSSVIAGLDPAIHQLCKTLVAKRWPRGSSPRVTPRGGERLHQYDRNTHWRSGLTPLPCDDAATWRRCNERRAQMNDREPAHAVGRSQTAQPVRTRAEAKITVQSSEAEAYDQTASPALMEIRLNETFTGDIEGESTVRALQVLRHDQSATLVSMQRLRGKLGGRQCTVMLQG